MEEPVSSFKVDYAASGRSTCTRCRRPIAQAELRIGPMVQSDKGDFKYPQWHHFHCFEDGWLKKNPAALTSTELVSGIDNLQFADQKKIKSLVVGGDSSLETKAVNAEEKQLASENKKMWAFRTKLDALSDGELKELSIFNDQPCVGKVFGGRSKMLDRLADAMAFGCLPKCGACKTGDFYFSHGVYKCTGAADEFAKCENQTQELVRVAMKVPAGLSDDHEFLAAFAKRKPVSKTTKRTAVLTAAREIEDDDETDEETDKLPKSSAENETSHADRKKRAREVVAPCLDQLKPFEGLVVMFSGRLTRTQVALEALVAQHGGTTAKTHVAATLCVCTPQEVSPNGSKKGQDAAQSGILCVSEGYIDAALAAGHRLSLEETTPFVLANSPGAAGEDTTRETLKKLGEKYELERSAQEQRALLEEKYTEAPKSKKHVAEVKKIVLKGTSSAAVEPESGLVEIGKIYEPVTGDVYSSVMNLTDVSTGKNSFYILQLIEHEGKSKWSVFRKWGRLGDDQISGTKLTDYPLASAAVREFKKVFLDKTGNSWESRSNFKKIYGKFMPIELDFSDSGAKSAGQQLNSAGYQGSLPRATQDLVSLIFDIKAMNDALKELEIDVEKMPLGKLSKGTIQEGLKSLNELNTILQQAPASDPHKSSATVCIDSATRTRIVSLTNRFYNFIPHVAPTGGTLPLLDTVEKVRQKNELLSALQDLEITSKLVCNEPIDAPLQEHPIDLHFKKLNCDMRLVDHSSEEFHRIDSYIQNTHGHTHTTYTLELVDLWAVDRRGEAERFQPHEKNPNKMLLWHGSRLTNWGGILSQGLRIAPPEAPTTGYMFGKGVYFADMSSKSANYCFTTSEKSTGILMLCEVALGAMKEYKHAFFVDKLTSPYQSTKGIGKFMPSPEGNYVEENGCVIPMGKGAPSGVTDTTLLYNEFIVYDTAQIRTRYVMRLNFNYKVKCGTFF